MIVKRIEETSLIFCFVIICLFVTKDVSTLSPYCVRDKNIFEVVSSVLSESGRNKNDENGVREHTCSVSREVSTSELRKTPHP